MCLGSDAVIKYVAGVGVHGNGWGTLDASLAPADNDASF